MARFEILIAPHPILREATAPVERIDDGVLQLLNDMLETMYLAPGIGLAAPQIGISRRVAVVDVGDGENRAPMRLINPEVVATDGPSVAVEEGCLSLPEQYAEVVRPERVRVRYLDETGAEREVEADGLLSRCLQHEIDHLDGVLFVDHLSMLKRQMVMRKLKKAQRLKQTKKAS